MSQGSWSESGRASQPTEGVSREPKEEDGDSAEERLARPSLLPSTSAMLILPAAVDNSESRNNARGHSASKPLQHAPVGLHQVRSVDRDLRGALRLRTEEWDVLRAVEIGTTKTVKKGEKD